MPSSSITQTAITYSHRDAGRSKNLGVPIVIGGHILPSPFWDRVNWSAKTWMGNCPPCPLISYAPVSSFITYRYICSTSLQFNIVFWSAVRIMSFSVRHTGRMLDLHLKKDALLLDHFTLCFVLFIQHPIKNRKNDHYMNDFCCWRLMARLFLCPPTKGTWRLRSWVCGHTQSI